MSIADELEAAAKGLREQALPAVVGVGSRGPSGSGILLAPGKVLTSAHNVRSEHPVVHFGDGAAREAEEVSSDLAGDLAVLSLETGPAAPLSWSEAGPRLGSPVYAAARPGAGSARLSFGVVAGLDEEFRGPGGRPISGSFEHTAPLPHGSSGGPVMDLEGRLLGINTKRLGEGLYAAISADSQLRQRLDSLSRGEPVQRAYLGVALLPTEAGRRLRSAVGLPPRAGALVDGLASDGPAEQAGLRRGDLITRAGAEEVQRPADLHRALSGRRPGEELNLELVRGVEGLELKVTLGSEPEPEARGHHHGFEHRR